MSHNARGGDQVHFYIYHSTSEQELSASRPQRECRQFRSLPYEIENWDGDPLNSNGIFFSNIKDFFFSPKGNYII